MKISAVILDLDGTLINTEVTSKRSWEQAAEEFGFEFSAQLYQKIAGGTIRNARREIDQFTGSAIEIDRFMSRAREFYLATLARDGVELMDGTLELLAYLDKSNLKYAVATSTERRYVDFKLRLSGLLGKVDVAVTGDEVSRSKPAPDIYLRAVEVLGLSNETKSCVAVEDAALGVEAAWNAGMITIMVPGTVLPSPLTRAKTKVLSPTLHEVIWELDAMQQRAD